MGDDGVRVCCVCALCSIVARHVGAYDNGVQCGQNLQRNWVEARLDYRPGTTHLFASDRPPELHLHMPHSNPGLSSSSSSSSRVLTFLQHLMSIWALGDCDEVFSGKTLRLLLRMFLIFVVKNLIKILISKTII